MLAEAGYLVLLHIRDARLAPNRRQAVRRDGGGEPLDRHPENVLAAEAMLLLQPRGLPVRIGNRILKDHNVLVGHSDRAAPLRLHGRRGEGSQQAAGRQQSCQCPAETRS